MINKDLLDLLTEYGAGHYEALSIEAQLINPETDKVFGTIDYNVWKASTLSRYSGDEFATTVEQLEPYLPTIYLKAKATIIGAYNYAEGNRSYPTWSSDLLEWFNIEDQVLLIPMLSEIFVWVKQKHE